MTSERFDYIIVGAGSAGCVIANRLTEDPAVRVLLLEAGGKANQTLLKMPLGFHFPRYPEVVWPYASEPETKLGGRRIPLPRGRVLGGSSTINGMLYSRGHPLDYDQWRQMGCEGWSFADILPYFKRSEASWRGAGPYHGADGPVAVSPVDTGPLLYEPVMEAARRCGYPATDDPHGENPEGFARAETTTTPGGRRASTATAYLHPIRSRPNLTILTGAQATSLVLEGRRATGIDYLQDGRPCRALATREVILSGGAMNSPQLLMLSGIGPAEELRAAGIVPVHDLPGVGRNLSEHASFYLEHATRGPVSFLKELRFDKVAWAITRWWLLGTGPFASQATTCNALVRTRPHLDRPDVQFFFNPVRMDARVWFPGIRPVQEHLVNAIIILLHPQSRGRISLVSSDPLAAPKIELNLLAQRADVETLIRGFRIARQIYGTEPLSGLIDRETRPGREVESDAEIEAYMREGVNVSFHPVGTCTMGHGPEAVVDPELRVHGMEGLRVADAAIMPTVPGGNTNMPTIMVGEKAADLIRGRTLPRAEIA